MKQPFLFCYEIESKLCYILSYGISLTEAQAKVELQLDLNKETAGTKVYLATLL